MPIDRLRFCMISRALVFALLACVACRPAEEDAGPLIAVDVCATDDVEDCALEFGERDISVLVDASVVVTNKSVTSPLTLLDVNLIGDPAFSLVDVPSTVAPRESESIIVRVRPNVEASLHSDLVILSDASNGERTGEDNSIVEVAGRITGVNNGIPDIEVDTTACTFDDVVTACTVVVTNNGNRELALDEVAVACDDECPFTVAGSVASLPAVGGSVALEVTYEPTPGAHDGSLSIASSDPDEPLVVVALTAT